MNDNEVKIVTVLLRVVATVVCVLILVGGSCTVYRNKAVRDMVMQGTDPLAVRCTFESTSSIDQVCLMKGMK